MSALIGRHGHGGGGRGHGGRRFFGGGGGGWGGWGWPWPLYTYPAYPYPYPWQQQPYTYFDVESSETMGAAVAALSPGADGLSCEMDLDGEMHLHVAICVDGRRHETSIDLSGLLCDIAERASRAHAARGASPAATDAAVQDVTTKTARAVQSAGTLLVGALYDRHLQEVTAGFWDSLKSAYRTASSPVTWFNKKVAQTIQKVPGLKKAVTMAATAVATAYGGPAAGAAASRLAGPIIDSSAETGGDPTMLFEKTKQDAHQHSGGDPKVAQAISHAQNAITQTAAAYTLKDMAQNAGAGDPEANQQIAAIREAAQAGDSAAARAVQLLAEIQGAPPDAPAATVGAASNPAAFNIHELRDLAFDGAARTRAARGFGDTVVFVLSRYGQFSVPFNTSTEALHYVYRVDPRSISYLAVVDVTDPSYPTLLHEHSFHHPTHHPAYPGVQTRYHGTPVAAQAPGTGTTTSSGAILPFALAAAAGALGGIWASNRSWESNLLDGALHGRTIRWHDRPIYVPAPGMSPASTTTGCM